MYILFIIVSSLLVLILPAVAQETISNEDAEAFDWVQEMQVSNPITPDFTCQGIPYPVANTGDLLTAINSANNDATCPGHDVIDLGGNTIVLDGSTIPIITSSMTIQNGSIRRDPAQPNDRIFYLNDANATFNLTNLELANGNEAYGAAVYAVSGYLNIENSLIRNNTSQYGAVRGFDSSTRIAISNTTFRFNSASANGAALALSGGAEGYVVNSLFETNDAGLDGGAIYIFSDSRLMMINVEMRDNEAGLDGGAIYSGGNTDLINVLMSGNLAGDRGGALYVVDDINEATDLELLNVTIAGNRAVNVSGGGGIRMQGGDADVDNTIVWGNLSGTSGGFASDNTTVNAPDAMIGFSRSFLEGGTPSGATNDDTNYYTAPLFVNPVAPTTFNMPNDAGNYRIGSSSSPAIDAGKNLDVAGGRSISSIEDDLDGKERIQNGIVDIGAYETNPVLNASADTNQDGIVSPEDVVYVINRLGTTDAFADVNNDGTVNSTDMQAVLNALGS